MTMIMHQTGDPNRSYLFKNHNCLLFSGDRGLSIEVQGSYVSRLNFFASASLSLLH